MSGKNTMTLGALFDLVKKEYATEAVQELDPETLSSVSSLLGELKSREVTGTEDALRSRLAGLIADLVRTLLGIRLEKAAEDPEGRVKLLDEEKYVLDSLDEMSQKRAALLSAVLDATPEKLESLSTLHRGRLVEVRFEKNFEEIIGADLEKYGPFAAGDSARIPYDNAQVLISQGIASPAEPDG